MPAATGSPTSVKTIGIVDVAAIADRVGNSLLVKIRSTPTPGEGGGAVPDRVGVALGEPDLERDVASLHKAELAQACLEPFDRRVVGGEGLVEHADPVHPRRRLRAGSKWRCADECGDEREREPASGPVPVGAASGHRALSRR